MNDTLTDGSASQRIDVDPAELDSQIKVLETSIANMEKEIARGLSQAAYKRVVALKQLSDEALDILRHVRTASKAA